MAAETPSTQPRADCCLRSSLWEGTPTGTESTFPGVPNPTYVAQPPSVSTSAPSRAAVLFIHDLLGWTFPNNRLLADAYAREANVTVYMPDFFGGEVVPFEPVLAGRFHEIDLAGRMQRSARAVREPEILAYVRALRESGRYDRIGAIGFCYGGWAVLRLAAEEFVDSGTGKGLVDCVTMVHPSLLTEKDIAEVAVQVPAQVLAPELDMVYTAQLKQLTFATWQEKGVRFEYVHFPGVQHGGLVRGDANAKGERAAMVRGKNAAVAWFRQWLHDE